MRRHPIFKISTNITHNMKVETHNHHISGSKLFQKVRFWKNTYQYVTTGCVASKGIITNGKIMSFEGSGDIELHKIIKSYMGLCKPPLTPPFTFVASLPQTSGLGERWAGRVAAGDMQPPSGRPVGNSSQRCSCAPGRSAPWVPL